MRTHACLFLCLFAAPAFAGDAIRLENLTVTAETAVTDTEFSESLAARGSKSGGGGNHPDFMTSGNHPNFYTASNHPDFMTAGNHPNFMTAGNHPNFYTGANAFTGDGTNYPEPELGFTE